MSDQELAKLEGLAVGLDQRGEKSAAQQVGWAHDEIERLHEVIKANNYAQDMTLREAGAEIERLRKDCKWALAEIGRLRAQNIATAAFLDRLAEQLVTPARLELFANRAMYATDCHAMAEKLRGEK